MNQSINTCITGLNNIGQGFWNYAAGIFIQSSVLIVLLLIVDSLLRKRVRAVFRYCLWMLVFIKLVMPASFTLPTGIGYWMGDYFPSEVSMAKWMLQTEEIVPTTLNIHQRSIPLEPVVTNETAVIDTYQGLIPLEPVMTNETAVTGIELEPICWQGLVFLGWLVGMLVLLVLLVKRFYFVRGLIAQSRPANGRLLELLEECRCLIGIRQNVELRLSGNRLSPADCGLFKPIILMPATLPKKLSREKLKAVLIHELAHIKRGDVWVNLLQTTLQIVYFYNPFVWLANAMVRRVREQAVDEMVLVTLKPETKSYSNMLIDIAEMAFWRPNFSLRLIGVVESKKALERRIKHMLSRPVPKSSKLGYLGLIAIIVIGAILLPMGSNSMAEAANIQKISRVHSETKTIVPGVGVGDYTLGMSKDEVLRKLGEPEEIFFAGERYTLDNLPKRYFMSFGDISFRIDNDTVKGITAISPYYKFTNGLGVGDSEKEIKQAFGDDLHLEEGRGRDFLVYKDKGLHFEIHKMDRTVMEINVTQAKHNQQSDRVSGKDVLNLIRQAAAEGRIAYKRTTPEEFKQIAGKPTEEQVSEDGEVVELEYSGIQVKFFGKPNLNKPVTILWIAYDGGNIDIGKDRYQKTVKVPSVQRFDKEQGKNPGLGIRRLHEKGITGRGVRIAILDQKLLVDHQEYAERVRLYEEIDLRARMNPQMHGAAVASIALGKTVGVAPEAELYYIAKKGGPRYVAQGINRILKINEQLPKDNKIRVISISVGWTPSVDSYEDNMAACERAKAAGIFVVSCSLEEVYGFSFHGLGRDPSADPDLFESYEPGLWWAKEFYEGTELRGSDCLLVPMDSRTTASPGGKDKYVFHREGGWSWSVPYIAGVYALAAQVEPDITPKRFWNLALKTGRTIQLEHEGEKRPFGLMIDPVRLIHSISDDEAASQQVTSKHTIVPGLRVGDYTLDMSKDEVLRKLGEPESIQLGEDEIVRRGEEKYNLNNLPRHYILSFGNISFWFSEDSVEAITVRSPLYKLSNGLGVGDSEQKIKQAFGEDFHLEEDEGKEYLLSDAEGLGFQIHNKNRTVAEIVVYKPEGDRDAPDQQAPSKNTIVPGVRVGDYMLGMSKQVLNKLGQPEGMSFGMDDGIVKGITVHSPLYKFTNGLGVGDSEQEIKQAFGEDFHLKDAGGIKDFLTYEDKGLMFEIHKGNRTVMEINVYQPTGDHGDSDAPGQQDKSKHTIVPGLGVGDYTLGMSKDEVEVLSKSGKPEGMYFVMSDGVVKEITVHSPLYKFTNGLGVGDSEEKIKPAFGHDFQFDEYETKDLLTYKNKGLQFKIHKKSGTIEEITIVKQPEGDRGDSDATEQEAHSKHTIVPGLRVGAYTLDMSKDDVLRKLGEPEAIQLGEDDVVRRGEERYNLNNLPSEYIMVFGDISFWMEDDSVEAISVHTTLYKLSNGLGVGDSEQKIKQAFGEDFKLEEALGRTFLCKHAKGLAFEIHKKNQTVAEIVVYKPEGDRGDSDREALDPKDKSRITLVRQAAEDGRISFKLTTPDEFKAIAGQPTREWTEADDELIYMEYPDIQVSFFGKPEINTPHTLTSLRCEGRGIDIGRNRPVVLRNEGDLDKFGTFWGYSSVDLSRLDLSQKGELLKAMPFDSRTVWPESGRLPPDFDPEAVMEWGKYPGLRVKQLHDRGVTGKGVHVAIIDQPLLLGHIEYRDQLVSYKEIETGNADPQMHGPPVASILVGKTCGVAPGAILHYWAEPSWKGDYKYRCIALEQIIQYNREKTKSEQIRVVSVSKGFSQSEPNLDRWKALLEKARQSGIYVVHCGSMGFGAGCRFLKDSDNPANYRLCAFYQGGDVFRESGTFFTPIDHRTTASQKARDVYTFWTRGGLSWGAPYYAGVVALGIQVNPDLRPDQIDKLLYDSGWDFQRGRLINPVGFVEAARAAGADGQ